MKRCYVVVAMLSILALSAGTALAAVTNGPHDSGINAGAQGVCSPCHLPHTGSTAARLWPVDPTTSLTPGTTPSLCASCHYSSGAYSGRPGFADARTTSGNVFGNYSHGKKMLKINIPPGQNMANSGLPYTASTDTGASIECTTCHNVHDDANRPFLRANIDVLCAMCHNGSGTQGRQFSSGALTTAVGAWGDNTPHRGANNAGSHPVGTDITEAAADAELLNPITFPAQFTAAKNAASTTQSEGTWSLGGHLISTTNPGVSCNTCHAVHGMARDAQDSLSGTYIAHETSPNMLVIDQTNSNYGTTTPTTGFAAEATSGRTIASGHNTAGSDLCEGCHVGPSPTGYTGRAVNPGGQLFTHPVDDYAATYEIVGAFPANWPFSSTVSGATGNAAICESCHTPHPAAWNPTSPAEGRATILPTAGPYILRANTTNICGQCHNGTVAFARHHPIGKSVAAATGTGAAAYLKTGIATWSDTLSCATCHTGQSGGAHNWKGKSSVAMNPNWRPADNGRVYPDTIADMFNAVTSATCIDCHLDLDGTAGASNLSPTMGTRTAGAAGTDTTETEYTYLGSGSHFLGQFAPAFLNGNKLIRSSNTNINVWTSPWTTGIFGTGNAAGGWSRFGGTTSAPFLVCESCHELQPGKNISSHMLLSSFREGQSDNLAYTAAYDDFCEACHGKPAGTHPMTADNVGRTATTLDTTINVATRPWLVTNAPKATPSGGSPGTSTWNTGGPTAGQMTCESCHQVHDANTAGASLIIEAPTANVTGGTPIAITATGYYGGGTISNRLREKTPSFGSGTPAAMPDVSRFCDQCHGYRAP